MSTAEVLTKSYIENYLAIDNSEFFDSEWYITQYPDILELTKDPVRHYLEHGFYEGCDPSPNFSTYQYLSKYSDVVKAGINPLVHYELFGKFEGRKIPKISGEYTSKRAKIEIDRESLSFFHQLPYKLIWAQRIRSKNASVLEIGPGSAPTFVGDNVFYFDIETADAKRESILSGPDKNSAKTVPQVIHFVSPDGDLTSIRRKFDVVYSCHCIEHTNDLVKHFQDVESLIDEGAEYYLVVPDKRYCFDHFKNDTTIADVLDAYYNKHRYKPLRTLIEEATMRTHNVPTKHWNNVHGVPEVDIEKLKQVIHDFENGKQEVDACHRWFLYPEIFVSILNILYELKLTTLKCVEIHESSRNNFEFYARLKKCKKID